MDTRNIIKRQKYKKSSTARAQRHILAKTPNLLYKVTGVVANGSTTEKAPPTKLKYSVPYSLDKQKRWELIEEIKKQQISEATEASDVEQGPKAAVYEEVKIKRTRRRRIPITGENLPIEVPIDRQYKWTVNRKGRHRVPIRPKGKKGVKRATHHNTYSAEQYELAKADEIYHVVKKPPLPNSRRSCIPYKLHGNLVNSTKVSKLSRTHARHDFMRFASL